jgi:hypothetical protein
MFFAYPVAFSLIALLTSFLPSTRANAHPIAVHPQTQSHTSHKDIDSTSTKVQTSYLSRRTVYNPNIIRPAQGDDWKVGSWVKVIWFVARSLFTSVFPNFVSNLVCLYISVGAGTQKAYPTGVISKAKSYSDMSKRGQKMNISISVCTAAIPNFVSNGASRFYLS